MELYPLPVSSSTPLSWAIIVLGRPVKGFNMERKGLKGWRSVFVRIIIIIMRVLCDFYCNNLGVGVYRDFSVGN